MATIRAKKVFKKVLKGSSISKAMREEGYAVTTASTTGKLTNTKGWQELLDKYIPEKELAKVHAAGLKATFTDKYNTDEVDFVTRHKYLETGYKIRGRIKNEIPLSNVTNILNVYTEEQLKRIAARVFDGESASETASDRLSDSDESTLRE